ncbi:MAG: thermonuclease family protein [Rhizobium sp.]|nr:thermonuclease family protein [Rhizobium sp.]
MTLLQTAASRVTTLATNLTSQSAGDQDEFPVSSIAKTPSTPDRKVTDQSRSRHYPVCPNAVAKRSNCVIDGDTFYFGATKVRISDIDAPETHPPRCAREADLGDRATRRLVQLLSAGAFQLVRADRDIDRYGRQLRIVVRDGRSLGKVLVAEGLARPWTGKRRPWCGSQDSFG